MARLRDGACRSKVAFGVVLNLDGFFFLIIRWTKAPNCGDRDLSTTALPADISRQPKTPKTVKHLVSASDGIWSRLRMKPSGTFAPFQDLGGDVGNMTANQRLRSHIKACEQQMSCVYARTAAEAKQIERRVAAGSVEAVMPGYMRVRIIGPSSSLAALSASGTGPCAKASRLDVLLLYGGCYLWPFGFACQFDAHPYRRGAGAINDARLSGDSPSLCSSNTGNPDGYCRDRYGSDDCGLPGRCVVRGTDHCGLSAS